MGGAGAAVDGLRARAGTLLDPAVVAAFTEHADELVAEAQGGDPRARVLELEPEPVAERHEEQLPTSPPPSGTWPTSRCRRLHGHSAGVAALAADAAQRLRVDARTARTLEVAALLHDIGRLAVTNVIWEKPGALTRPSGSRCGCTRTTRSESSPPRTPSEPAAPIAGMHHERLDGVRATTADLPRASSRSPCGSSPPPTRSRR